MTELEITQMVKGNDLMLGCNEFEITKIDRQRRIIEATSSEGTFDECDALVFTFDELLNGVAVHFTQL